MFRGNYGLETRGFSINDEIFLNMLAEETLNPPFIKDIKYVSSSSAMISRLYSVDDKDKLNTALKLFLQRKKSFKNGRPDLPGINWFFPGQFINRWIKKFEIGEKIIIDGTDEGLGVMVYLVKEKEQKSLLADEGYGITQLFSLMLHIDNMMLEHEKPYFICVEEPEIHLHPKYQSMLAEMFDLIRIVPYDIRNEIYENNSKFSSIAKYLNYKEFKDIKITNEIKQEIWDTEEELNRVKQFKRIFPTVKYPLYQKFFDRERCINYMLYIIEAYKNGILKRDC